MGFFANIFKGIADFFRTIFDWVGKLINELTRQFRYWKVKWSIEIAGWLEDDFNFLLGLAVLIVGSMMLPSIIAFAKQLAGKLATSVLLAFGLNESITWKQLRALLNLDAMHSIAKIMFPDYQKAANELNKALSDFTMELKFGAGYLHSYLAMCKGIISGTAAIFNLPPETVEYDWFVKASDWAATIEDNLYEYARNPHKMYSDIVEKIMLPLQAEYTDSQQKELDDIYKEIERINEIRGGLREITESLQTWIESLPDEIQAVFDRKIGPGLEDIREAMDTLDLEVFDKITAVVDRLQELENTYQDLNKKIEEKKPEPLELMLQHEELNEKEKAVFSAFIVESMEPEASESIRASNEEILPELIKFLPQPPTEEEMLPSIASLSYEGAQMFVPRGLGRVGGERWFIGEY
jgi:hypothetical protein